MLLRQAEFGPGLTPDSALYVSTAHNLLAGAGFVPFHGVYARAPLYPLILAATSYFHDDMIAAAGVLNAIAFGLSVCVALAWLRRRQVSAPLMAWAGLALAFSPLAGVAAYVWSEAVFVLFVLAALFSLDRFLVAGTRRMLFVAAGFAALCCLTRYAGASVLVCATVLIATRSQWRPTRRVRAAALYVAIGIAPTAVWLVRNLRIFGAVSGDLSMYRDFAAMDMLHMAVELMLHTTVGPTVLDWIDVAAGQLPITSTGTRLLWLLAIWGLVACGLAVSHRAGPSAEGERCVPAVFALCYVASVAVAMALTGVKAEPRFFAPVIAPMLLTLVFTFHAIHAIVRRRRQRRFVAALLSVTLSLWLAQWLAANTAEIRQWSTHGSDGYGERRWAESATAASLRSGGQDGLLFSNNPIAAYLLAHDGATPRASVTPLRPRMAPNSKVAWFYRAGEVPSLMEFLHSFPGMGVIATHADGIVFQQGATHRTDDTVDQLAEALLREVSEGVLVATSRFNVYWAGEAGGESGHLMYVKHNCETADTRPMFFLHVTPKSPDNPPVGRTDGFWRPVLARFHNLDFRFAARGVRHRDVCIATHALPSYAIAEIRTGQWSRESAEEIWSTSFTVPPKRSP